MTIHAFNASYDTQLGAKWYRELTRELCYNDKISIWNTSLVLSKPSTTVEKKKKIECEKHVCH